MDNYLTDAQLDHLIEMHYPGFEMIERRARRRRLAHRIVFEALGVLMVALVFAIAWG